MKSHVVPLAAIFVLGAFAGCTSKQVTIDVPEVTLVTKDAITGESLFLKPNLTVGRWWEAHVAVDFGGGFLQDIDGKIVVTKNTDKGFDVGSDVEDLGIFDAYFDSFYVGPLDNELNPTIRETNVEFFNWPLKAGQTWTTKLPAQDFGTFNGRVDDLVMNVTAFDEDNGPDAPRLRVQGKSAHGETIDFDYSARTGWMTYFRMVNASTGQVVVSIDYKASGVGFAGTVHQISITPLYIGFKMTPPFDPSMAPVPPADRVTVPDGYTWVEEIIILFTFPVESNVGGGAVAAVIAHPDHTFSKATATGLGDTHPGAFQRNQIRAALAGDWAVSILPAATGGGFVGLFGFKDEAQQF